MHVQCVCMCMCMCMCMHCATHALPMRYTCTCTAQPGETLVVPEGWWHYAASLTPSITLMCILLTAPTSNYVHVNPLHPLAPPHLLITSSHPLLSFPYTLLRCNFYDQSNVDGLRASFYSAAARALDETQRRARAAAGAPAGAPPGAAAAVPRRVAASPEAAARSFDAAVAYRVVHAPFVYLRGAPDTQAPMVAIAVAGEVLHMSAERDGWLCTVRPVAGGGERGWALRDGAPLGLGMLLVACDM